MIAPILLMACIGLVAGVCLAFATKFFGLQKDERFESVKDLLPGANCGACGYPGCAGLAAAMVKGEAPANACPVADNLSLKSIAVILGAESNENVKKKAVVLCSGGKNAYDKYEYHGPKDCYSMSLLLGGVKHCVYGCLGGGSCTKVCAFDAIKMGPDGLPVVSEDLCTGCGMCADECPRNIIAMKKVGTYSVVLCSSHDKGVDTKKFCSAGCIGCGLCQKVCTQKAIAINNFLAVIDENKCSLVGECIKKCPVSVISILKRQ